MIVRTVRPVVTIQAVAFAVVLLSGLLVVAGLPRNCSAADHVTLLLPGMVLHPEQTGSSFGRLKVSDKGTMRWGGTIGRLEQSGERFGGVIQPRGSDLSLPRCLNRRGVRVDPRRATVFELDFSTTADIDGLAYKTLELAECLEQLRHFTGCEKVQLVAYSAGGLVARTYLQSALPRVKYAGDVSRLITVATPHLGSTKAEHFGDFLGTRATALKPSSPLVQRLNDDLELPGDVQFASIVVRGVRIGSRKIHQVHENLFASYVDRNQIARLPLDYRKGCDQVVNVWSQNLALTRAGRKYEQKNGRPIQFLLARVADPSPSDICWLQPTVHDVAANDQVVTSLIILLAKPGNKFWTGIDGSYRERWIDWQAKNFAFGIIENAMARRHRFSEVYRTRVSGIRKKGERDGNLKFAFTGSAQVKWRLPPRMRRSSEFSGTMELRFDDFGRVTHCRYQVARM